MIGENGTVYTKYVERCFVNGERIPCQGRYGEWVERLGDKIAYFQQRKAWARRLLKRAGLSQPGDETEGTFLNDRFAVKIGPRGGIRIQCLEAKPFGHFQEYVD